MSVKKEIKKAIPKLKFCINVLFNFKHLINLRTKSNFNNQFTYTSEPDGKKRYITIDFDDFRESDFEIILPLFKKYGAHATFNRISYNSSLSTEDILKMCVLAKNGNEIGDHTWFHYNYIFDAPLCNGQEPNNTEGKQPIFPSDQQRESHKNNKNAFGFDLSAQINEDTANWIRRYSGKDASCWKWGSLSDEQCQDIRNAFSLYKDTTGLLDVLDELSNKYLGTTGSSAKSWDNEKECYTGGIYTDCKTSCNHEVWERILEITKNFYQENYNNNFAFRTWSWPGGCHNPFIFGKNNHYYYDESCTTPYNYLAKFASTLDLGTKRSWVDVLRKYGYTNTHSTLYPSKKDGLPRTMMKRQLIYNAHLSRKDALVYGTESSIPYTNFAADYPKSTFDSLENIATRLYEKGGTFYRCIESIRNETANGIIHGEVIDSTNDISEKIFLEQVLKYCKSADIEVVGKQVAYDICFNHPIYEGNLIYNPDLKNTAKEFMKDAKNVPSNPDGYLGECSTVYENDKPTLCVNKYAEYLHCGIPLGDLLYSANIRGTGEISIYLIKNSDEINLSNDDICVVKSLSVSTSKYKNFKIDFSVPDNCITPDEPICEGLGNKIMAIKIVYSGNLCVNNIVLKQCTNRNL